MRSLYSAGGQAEWSGGEKTITRDTFTCTHCNTVVFVTPKMAPTEMGGYCASCHAPICKCCVGKPCVPFEKKLLAMERKAIDSRRLDAILKGD